MKKISTLWGVIIILAVAVVLFGGCFAYQYFAKPQTPTINDQQNPGEQVMCTTDAMECPDGSFVGRTGPNCEFVCPTTTEITDTSDWKTYTNSEYGFSFQYPTESYSDLKEEKSVESLKLSSYQEASPGNAFLIKVSANEYDNPICLNNVDLKGLLNSKNIGYDCSVDCGVCVKNQSTGKQCNEIKCEIIQLNNNKAVKIVENFNYPDYYSSSDVYYIFSDKNNYFNIGLFTGFPDKIISTFKFTPVK